VEPGGQTPKGSCALKVGLRRATAPHL